MSTATVAPGSTPTSPTARSLVRRARGPVLVGAALVLLALAVAFLQNGNADYLDTDSYAHGGSHAVAALLRDQGIPVHQVRTVADAAATRDGTLVVVGPDLLTTDAARRLASSGARTVVLVGATDDGVIGAFAPGAHQLRPVDTGVRQPACPLPAAVAAGAVDAGGSAYTARPGTTTASCYPAGGDATLLVLNVPTTSGASPRTVVLLGSADPLLNGRIARQGNAALALNLLGSDPAGVTWYLPSLGDLYDNGGGHHQVGLLDLLPHSVVALLGWLVVVVLLLAAWRGRRLGPVVTEPLPVVVRASETTEGRARLYRRGRTRGRAADLLRGATRDRLGEALGLPAGATRETVVDAVARRCGRSAVEVTTLLYGAAPRDDASLVRLAHELDDLERRTLDRPEERRP